MLYGGFIVKLGGAEVTQPLKTLTYTKELLGAPQRLRLLQQK